MSFMGYLAALFAVVWGGPKLVDACYFLAFRRSVVRRPMPVGGTEGLAMAGALFPPQHYPADHSGGGWGQGYFVPSYLGYCGGGEGFAGHGGGVGFDGSHGHGGCDGGCAHGT